MTNPQDKPFPPRLLVRYWKAKQWVISPCCLVDYPLPLTEYLSLAESEHLAQEARVEAYAATIKLIATHPDEKRHVLVSNLEYWIKEAQQKAKEPS